jgi:hypothetical protein
MASLPLSAILFREPHDPLSKSQYQEAFTYPAALAAQGCYMPKQTIIFQSKWIINCTITGPQI